MPTDLTGTPTSLGIGTYNVDVDAPSGLGFNEAMAQINALLSGTNALGTLGWGPTPGGLTIDATVAREAAGVLKVSQHLHVNQSVVVDLGGFGSPLYFGSLYDTSLYRDSAGVIRTTGYIKAGAASATSLMAEGSVWLSHALNDTTPGNGIYFGSSADTNLYRAGANNLKTDSRFDVGGAGDLRLWGTNGGLTFGVGGTWDSNLYRIGAGALKTDGLLQATGIIYAQAGGGANELLLGWNGSSPQGLTMGGDTNLYRSAAGTLKTDGNLVVTGSLTVGGGGFPKITTSAMSGGPPASPSDGDIWIATGVDANGTRWQFQYNAGSASAYKWEFIGGSALGSDVHTSETNTTLSTWVDLATNGPIVTTARAGEYNVSYGAEMWQNAAGTIQVGLSITGAAPSDVSQNSTQITAGGMPNSKSTRLTTVAGDTIRVRYWNGAGTGRWQERWLRVVPVRIS